MSFCALAADIIKHHDIDMLQISPVFYNEGRPDLHPFLGVTLGSCFCKNCEREAKKQGLDWEKITGTVKYWADALSRRTVEGQEDYLLLQRGNSTPLMFLLEYPELYQWLKFRSDSATKNIIVLSQAVHAANPKIDFRFNTCWEKADLIGLNFREIRPYIDSIRIMDYSEQSGDEERVLNKGKWLANIRRQTGEDMTIISAIASRGKATPDLILKGIRTVAYGGADGLSYGFYDGASMELLSAIKNAMKECEIVLRDSKGTQ